ncbi:MAG: large subunit ribosomal protein L9 [Rhodothermales bacterium]|jgi:large subunit ribosomal protein L9
MKVILLQEVENLGDEGEIVTVKNGYGLNYLIPRGFARLATVGTIKAWEEERRQSSRKLAQKQGDAQALASEIGKMDIVLNARVGEENRIFGTITSQQIVDALASQGVTVDRRKVELDEEVRMLGVYTASVRIHSAVTATVKFRVEAEGAVAPVESEPESESESA